LIIVFKVLEKTLVETFESSYMLIIVYMFYGIFLKLLSHRMCLSSYICFMGFFWNFWVIVYACHCICVFWDFFETCWLSFLELVLDIMFIILSLHTGGTILGGSLKLTWLRIELGSQAKVMKNIQKASKRTRGILKWHRI
jgi:hypothetical protein